MDEDAHLEAEYEERTDIGDDEFEYLYEDPPEQDDWDPGPEVDDEGGMSEVRNQIRHDAMDPEVSAAIWQRTEDDAERGPHGEGEPWLDKGSRGRFMEG